MTRIKVCGLTRIEDLELALELGVHAVGLNFVPGTPRALERGRARELALRAADRTLRVGVFRDAPREWVLEIAREVGLDGIQLHGAEPPEYAAAMPLPVIKALRATSEALAHADDFDRADLLVDHPSGGGSGQGVDAAVVDPLFTSGRRVWLAGGLRPENVRAAIQGLRPYGVDAASGLEQSPGIKDPDRLRSFVAEVRAAG